MAITLASYGCYVISNHRHLDDLLSSLFGLTSKKTPEADITIGDRRIHLTTSSAHSISISRRHHAMITILTHWGRVTHICVGNLTIIGSDNCLSPGLRQAIIWTSAGILLIGPLGTNFSEILIGVQIFSLTKMHLKMSAKWRSFCPGLHVLIVLHSMLTRVFCINGWQYQPAQVCEFIECVYLFTWRKMTWFFLR